MANRSDSKNKMVSLPSTDEADIARRFSLDILGLYVALISYHSSLLPQSWWTSVIDEAQHNGNTSSAPLD